MTRSTWLLAAILLPLLAGVIAAAAWMWGSLEDTDMGLEGWIALVGGVIATLAVGGGLMGLVFYSSRHGYDDGVGEVERE